MPGHFDEIEVGLVESLGVCVVDEAALTDFVEHYAPGWDVDGGLPDSLVFTVWSKLDSAAAGSWPQTKRLGVDALRWVRNPPAGELLRGRVTVVAKDQVGQGKGLVIAQNDLLDEAGRLVFSCLTRSIFACRGPEDADLLDED